MELSVNEICRVCLTKSPTLFSIFDDNPALNTNAYAVEFLLSFCKISLETDSSMPDKVCPLCAEEIKRCYAFKVKCERSAGILKKYAEQMKEINKNKRGISAANQVLNARVNTSPTLLGMNTESLKVNEEFSPQAKRTRKKFTKMRPLDETIKINESHNNIVDERRQCDEIVCIDDDDNSNAANAETIENNKTAADMYDNSLPFLISNVTSGAVSTQLGTINNTVLPTESTSANEGSDSPVSVILMIEEDNQSETEDKMYELDEQDTNLVIATGSKEVIEIVDDEPPANVDNTPNEDTFICHLCSTIVNGQTEFINHIKEHKENIQTDTSKPEIGSVILAALTSSSSNALLCHLCYQMIEGIENFADHLKNCKSPSIKITAEECLNGYKCNNCCAVSENRAELIKHVRKAHMSSTSMYICGVCLHEFPSSESLSDHINKRVCLRYECKVCGEDFNTQSDCDFHMEQCHKKRKIASSGKSRLLT